MNILKSVGNAFHYVVEAASRVLSPSHDEYPEIGVQPFNGEPYSKWVPLNHEPPKSDK